jgi:gliding motility-associated-like protein
MKLYRLILYLLLLSGNNYLLAHSVETSGIRSDTTVVSNISLPLYFVKNNGQCPVDIKYKLHAAGMNLLFFDSCVTYQFYHNYNSQKDEISNSKGSKSVNNISVSFVNPSKKVVLIGDELLEGKINCFNGTDATNWQTNVPTSQNLVYKGLYDNIDIKYYSLKGKIKYDIIVHPQGDLDKVVFQYQGVEKIMKDRNGKLILNTKKGNFTEDIPEAYQIVDHKKRLVKIDYQINDNNWVSFKIRSKYDPSCELVVDPSLIYSTYIGGTNDDQMYLGDMVKDNQGCIYTCGQTMSSNFPVTPGSYDVSQNGDYDCFVLKLNKTGTALVYATYIGGSDIDQPNSIDIDKTTNEIFVAGTTASSNFPVTAGAYQTTYGGGTYDVFVLKINSAGNSLVYSTFVGGGQNDQCGSLKIDNSGNAYAVGQTAGQFPVTAGSYQTLYGGGGWDEYAFKLNPSGSALIFSTYVGGTGDDRGCGVAIDQNLNVYVYGMTTSGFPTSAGAYQTIYGGGTNDACVSKLNPTGSTLIYSTYLGGPGDDYMRGAIEVDNNGQAYITGLCQTGFPTTAGAYDVTYNGGNYDVFVAKLNSSGSGLVFSTFLGGSGTDIGFNIAFNQNKEVLVTGEASNTFPVTACAYDVTFNGVSDGFLSKLDSTGANLLYSTFIGGSGYDRGSAIVPDGDTVYMVGNTQSSNFPTTAGCFDPTFNSGTNDIFALKLFIGPANMTADFSSPPTACIGENISFINNSTGATSFSWVFGNGNSSTNVNPVYAYPSAGSYYITLTATGACGIITYTDTIVILNAPAISVSHDTTVCSGSPVTLIASGGSTYSWNTTPVQSGANITVSPTASTTYIVTVTDANGCTNTADVVVQVTFNITISTSASPQTICPGNPSTLTATGGSLYTWTTVPPQTGSSIIVNPVSTSIYSVTGTTGNCSGSATVTVSVDSVLHVTANSIYANCGLTDGSATVNVGGGNYTFLWSTVPAQTTQTAVGLSAGTYTVTVENNGCVGTATVTISNNSGPVAGFNTTPEIVTVGGGAVNFIDQSLGNIIDWAWDFGDGTYGSGENISHNYSDSGVYMIMLIVTDIGGCMDTAYGTIMVNPGFVFWIPNSFSPDGDGENDYFRPMGAGYDKDHYLMRIFERWGKEMFVTTDINIGWNGTLENKYPFTKAVLGIYVYHIEVNDLYGKSYTYKGSIFLLK